MPYDFGKHKEKREMVKAQESPKMQAMRRRLGQYSSGKPKPYEASHRGKS